MNLKVKDFAVQQGVSESIVYRHIRQHKEELGENVIKKARATWITEEGQEFLRGLMVQQPITILEPDQRVLELEAQIRELEKQLHEKEKMLTAAHQQVTEAQKQVSRAQEQVLALQGNEVRVKQLEADTSRLNQERKAVGDMTLLELMKYRRKVKNENRGNL